MSALPAPRGSSARRAPVRVHQTSQDPLGELEVPTGVDRSIDSVQLFLRDIGRTPLLTDAQETVLAKADRTWRSDGERRDGRCEPAARGVDREALSESGAAVHRPDPGRDDRAD